MQSRIETVASEVKESVIKEAMAMAHQATKIIIDAQLVEAYRRKYPPVSLTSSASISTSTSTPTPTSTSTTITDETLIPTSTSTSIPSKVKKVKKSRKVVGEEKEGSVMGSANDKEVESMIIAKQAKSKTNDNNNNDGDKSNNFFTKLNKKIDQHATIMNGGEKIAGEEIINENEITSSNQKSKKSNENKIENNNEIENENKVKTLFKEGAEKRKYSENLRTLDVTKLLNLFSIGNSGLESALLKRMKMVKDEHAVTNDDGKNLAWSVSEQDNILIDALKAKNIPQVQTRKNPTLGNKIVNAVLNDELTELGDGDKSSAEAMLEALYVNKVETKGSDGESVFKRPTATVDTVEAPSEKVVSSVGKGKKGKNKAVIAPTATSGEKEGGGGGSKVEDVAAVAGAVKKSKKKKAAPTVPVAEVEVVDEVKGVESKLAAMMTVSNSRSHIASIDTTPAGTFTQAAAASSLSGVVAAMESEAASSNSNSNSKISSNSVSDGVLESPLPTTPHLVPSPAHTSAPLSTSAPTPTSVSASKVALEQLQHQRQVEVAVEVAVDPSVKYSLPIKTGFAMPEGLKDFAFTAGYGEAVKLFRLSCGMSAEGGAIPEGTGSTASISKQVRSRGEGSLRAAISQKITEDAEWGTAHPVSKNLFPHTRYFFSCEILLVE